MMFRVLQSGELRTVFGPEKESDRKAKELLYEESEQ
jgi:hypothetical protein